jgi:hypothetical protein
MVLSSLLLNMILLGAYPMIGKTILSYVLHVVSRRLKNMLYKGIRNAENCMGSVLVPVWQDPPAAGVYHLKQVIMNSWSNKKITGK